MGHNGASLIEIAGTSPAMTSEDLRSLVSMLEGPKTRRKAGFCFCKLEMAAPDRGGRTQ